MKLLIDGDALIFPILEACKDEAISDDGEVLWQQLQFKESLEQIDAKIDWFGHKDFLIAFSCPSPECFRRDLSPTYKANRSGIKPLGFTRTITSLRERYECLTWPRLEADDILGILQSQPDTETMIVGVDKDFLTVPGKVMHPGTRDVVSVSQEEADYNHLVQTLTGDSTDGYPGAKGVGPKAVEKLGYPLTWGQVVDCFHGDEEAALVQARLARILRWEDWDRGKKEPILWNPVIGSGDEGRRG